MRRCSATPSAPRCTTAGSRPLPATWPGSASSCSTPESPRATRSCRASWFADVWSVDRDVRSAFAASPAEVALPGGWYRNQLWVVPGPHGDVLLCLGIYGQLVRVDPADPNGDGQALLLALGAGPRPPLRHAARVRRRGRCAVWPDGAPRPAVRPRARSQHRHRAGSRGRPGGRCRQRDASVGQCVGSKDALLQETSWAICWSRARVSTCRACRRSGRTSGPTRRRSTRSARRRSTCWGSTASSATSTTSPTTTPGTASTPRCSARRTSRTWTSRAPRRSTTTCCATPRCRPSSRARRGERARRRSPWSSSTRRPSRSARSWATS